MPGHERGPKAGLRSDDFAGTKWKNLTGTTRWSDGTEMSPSTSLTSPACSGECARASRPGWTRWKPGRPRPSGGRRIHKKHGRRPHRLRGSPHRFRQQQAQVRNPSISRGEQRVLAGPLALHRREAAGPSEQPRGRERPRPPTQRASPGAMPARIGRPQRKSY